MGTPKAYLEDGGDYNDITPLNKTVNCGTDPITTGTAGSGIITVTATAHGSKAGNYVTLAGATAVDGIAAELIKQNFEILTAPYKHLYS